MRILAFLSLLISGTTYAGGNLSDDIRISSEALGYDLQYRVYAPENAASLSDLPVLFVTDGPGYISSGRMHRVLNRQIESGEVRPIVAVFVDARDPDDLGNNRRNSQFLCNEDYLHFYKDELIPEIEAKYPVGRSREHRGILGISFGGTNAACFGLFGYDTFSLIGMQSPANHPVEGLLLAYEQVQLLPLKMYLSTGRPNDNTSANRRFRDVLQSKGYEMEYKEVSAGHNWSNWRPLLDDVLQYFYAASE